MNTLRSRNEFLNYLNENTVPLEPKTKSNEYCIFILTHRRPHAQMTYNALKATNVGDKIYFIVDDEDPTLDEYVKLFGGRVIVFCKQEVAKAVDTCTYSSAPKNAVVFARNAVYDIAKRLGYDFFAMFDDDYRSFEYVYNHEFEVLHRTLYVKDYDYLFRCMFDFLRNCPHNVKTICFAQSGEFIGGKIQKGKCELKRKAMNTFFCMTSRRIVFTGLLNEDVNAYVTHGMRGDILLTTTLISIHQAITQAQRGGLTDIYRALGTYRKTMYTIIQAPSFCALDVIGMSDYRAHHKINYRYGIPYLIREC